MKRNIALLALISTAIVVATPSARARATGCLNGSCHQDLTKMKHMHGPIGAELAGAKGCIICHIPAGAECSQAKAGEFQIKDRDMCLTCHDKGTSSRHANATTNCLQCHHPHGSNSSPYMLR